MPEVGVRELKARASEILREVRDRRVRYTVTHRGRAVGLLLPIGEGGDRAVAEEDGWTALDRLGEEIGRGWCSAQSSAELLSAARR